MESSPNRESGNDVGGGLVEKGRICTLRAWKGNFGAFTLDKGVGRKIVGPVCCQVERTAIGNKADLIAQSLSE